MAHREALRELQLRLARRLQAAKTEAVSVSSWLAVELAGGGPCLVPLAHAGEIFPWSVVQPVPYTRDWFLGVANLRGGLAGVIDLARFLGAVPVRTEQALAETSLLTLNGALELNAALLVDRLAGLRGADAFESCEPPSADAPPFFGRVYRDGAGVRWQELNLQALSQHPEFLGISA